MQPSRTQALVTVLMVTVAFAALVLADVLWTAFFAVTVAYVLVPVVAWLRERGLSTTWASVVATLGGTLALLGLFAMVGFLVYRRRGPIIDFLTSLPDNLVLEVLGTTYVISVEAAFETAVTWLSGYAVALATALPTIGLKVTLFAFVVFGLLVGHEAVEEAVMSTVPGEYHDIASALARRTMDTLYAIYVLQVLTGAATFVLALPVFVLLGYNIPITLSFIAGVLQFLPIVGPSVLLAALAIYQLSVGNVVAAILVLVIGGVVIAWLPDILIRPRLAERTGRLPGTLYLIGFLGGLLTVGAVGIIAGPLAVALVVEAISLLGAENTTSPAAPDEPA